MIRFRRGDAYIAPPPVLLTTLRRGDPCGRPRAGKSAKRRQWRMKQAGFEEVPRLAGTTVPVNRSAQQCPSIGRHNGGQESPSPTHPMIPFRRGRRPRRPARRDLLPFRRGRCLHRPAGHSPPLCKTPCHCEASAHTGCGNPLSASLVLGYYGFPRPVCGLVSE